jgi:hypothetical protein
VELKIPNSVARTVCKGLLMKKGVKNRNISTPSLKTKRRERKARAVVEVLVAVLVFSSIDAFMFFPLLKVQTTV